MTRLKPEREQEIREYWKDIPGFDGWYQASNLGRIRTLKFVNYKSDKLLTEPKILKPSKWGDGYLKVCLKRKGRLIHRLILETFIGAPDGRDGAHLNGDRSDNRIVNLKWVTRKENFSHKLTHGTAQRGMNNPNAKLNDHLVFQIRYDFSLGLKQSEISTKYGLRLGLVHDVVHRKRWAHV